MMGCHLDITERKKIENLLKTSEEKFKTLFELAPDAYYLMDYKGRFLDGNKKAQELIGYQKKRACAENVLWKMAFLPSNQIPKIIKLIEIMRKNIEINASEIELKKKNGQIIQVELSTIPIKISQKDVILGIARDISQRKNLEMQLRQAQKMEAVGTLAGGVAHDFNNILTTVIGNADFLAMEFSKGHDLFEVIEEIKMAGERGARLTHQLLAFSRKQVIQANVLDINDVLRESEKMFRRLLREDIVLRMILKPDVGKIFSDAGQIDQIFMESDSQCKRCHAKRGCTQYRD